LPKIWSLKSLFDFGRQVRFPANISIHLENQKLRIDDAFSARLGEIFPGDPLPDVFVPPASIRESTASIPMLLCVNYPLWPLFVVIGLFILLLLTGFFLFSRSRSTDSYEILVDDVPRPISLGRFESKSITDDTGLQIGIVKRRGATPSVESVSPGHTLSLRS